MKTQTKRKKQAQKRLDFIEQKMLEQEAERKEAESKEKKENENE